MGELRAIEHRGEVYLHVEDLERFLASRLDRIVSPVARDTLVGLVVKLREVRAGRTDVDKALQPR